MTWVECTDELGIGWRATFVDGRVDEEVVKRKIKDKHPEIWEKDITIYDIAEVVNEARNGFHKQHKHEELAPYCDFFVFSPSQAATDTINSNPADTETSRQNMPEDITYLLQIDKNCPFYKDCLENTIQALNMENMPESEYADIGSYQRWIRKFGSKLLRPYIAPCMIVEEKIKEHGFQCGGE